MHWLPDSPEDPNGIEILWCARQCVHHDRDKLSGGAYAGSVADGAEARARAATLTRWNILTLLPYAVEAGWQLNGRMLFMDNPSNVDHFEIERVIDAPELGSASILDAVSVPRHLAMGQHRLTLTLATGRDVFHIFHRLNQDITVTP